MLMTNKRPKWIGWKALGDEMVFWWLANRSGYLQFDQRLTWRKLKRLFSSSKVPSLFCPHWSG
jgi:hypothetical protein